jgi:hypothetical protein
MTEIWAEGMMGLGFANQLFFHFQQCFVSAVPKDQHSDSLTDVCYAENARMFVTGSRDGNVKS